MFFSRHSVVTFSPLLYYVIVSIVTRFTGSANDDPFYTDTNVSIVSRGATTV